MMDQKIETVTLVPGGHAFYAEYAGRMDMFHYDNDPHMGPQCAICYECFCTNCEDDLNGLCSNRSDALPGMDYN